MIKQEQERTLIGCFLYAMSWSKTLSGSLIHLILTEEGCLLPIQLTFLRGGGFQCGCAWPVSPQLRVSGIQPSWKSISERSGSNSHLQKVKQLLFGDRLQGEVGCTQEVGCSRAVGGWMAWTKAGAGGDGQEQMDWGCILEMELTGLAGKWHKEGGMEN